MWEIDAYREKKKENFVKNILQNFIKDEKILSAFFGQCEIIPYKFVNENLGVQAFSVKIDDPDEKFLNAPELTLV